MRRCEARCPPASASRCMPASPRASSSRGTHRVGLRREKPWRGYSPSVRRRGRSLLRRPQSTCPSRALHAGSSSTCLSAATALRRVWWATGVRLVPARNRTRAQFAGASATMSMRLSVPRKSLGLRVYSGRLDASAVAAIKRSSDRAPRALRPAPDDGRVDATVCAGHVRVHGQRLEGRLCALQPVLSPRALLRVGCRVGACGEFGQRDRRHGQLGR